MGETRRAILPDRCPGCKADLTRDGAVLCEEAVPATYYGSVGPDGSFEYSTTLVSKAWWDSAEPTGELSCGACENLLALPSGDLLGTMRVYVAGLDDDNEPAMRLALAAMRGAVTQAESGAS